MKFINGKLDGSSFLYEVKYSEVEKMIKEYYTEQYPNDKIENPELNYVESTYDTEGYYYGEVTIKRKMTILEKEEICKDTIRIEQRELFTILSWYFKKLDLKFEFWLYCSSKDTICVSVKKLIEEKENKEPNSNNENTSDKKKEETITEVETEITSEVKPQPAVEELEEVEQELIQDEKIIVATEPTIDDIIDYLNIVKEFAKKKAKQTVAKTIIKILS